MAAIKENRGKDGKIISFRLRTCPGRDAAGQQVWRTTTITMAQVEDEAAKQGIEKLTPAKMKRTVEAIANQWEAEEREKFNKAPSAKDKGRTLLKDFILDVWIPIYVKDGKKSPNSVRFFVDTCRYAIDFMGGKRLNQIDTEQCSKFVSYLNSVAKKQNGDELSETSKMHIFGTLRNILRTAKRWRYVESDPTEDMTRGERPHRAKKDVAFMSENEVRTFLKALEQEPVRWRVYFKLLLVTGMRRGEAVALQWSDIDDGKKIGYPAISVSKSVVVDKNAPDGRRVKGTKTGQNRVIPITETTLQMLMELKRATEKDLGAAVMPSAYVFSSEGDAYKPLHPTEPTKRMQRLVSKYKLEKCTVHELRRTFATLALQSGIDPKTVASLTGHSDVSTLFRYYSGTDSEQQQKAIQGLTKGLLSG